MNNYEETNNTKVTSSDMIARIKSFESLKYMAYLDAKGVPTIGYGHTAGVKLGQTINEKKADAFLRDDLRRFESGVIRWANRKQLKLTQHNFDALVCFTFNVGLQAFYMSKLAYKIAHKRSIPEIKKEWRQWAFSGGHFLRGLLKRRIFESDYFFKPD